MLHFERWKIIAIVLTILAGVMFTLPNFFSKETVDGWPWWMPHRQLPLGLDLRGGAHLLLAMDTKELEKDWLSTLRDDARRQLREAKVGFQRSRSLASTGYQIATAVAIAGLVWFGVERLEVASSQLIVLVVVFARILPVAGSLIGDLQDGSRNDMHNCNFFDFDAEGKFKRVIIWMAGTNPLH